MMAARSWVELLVIEMAVRVDEFHLLQPGSDGDAFEEGDERGRAAFEAGGDDHALGGKAAEFAGFEIGDDDDFAADELFGLIGEGNAGDDGAGFGFADVDFEVKEFVGTFDFFGGFDFADAEVDFGEVVDGDGWREWSDGNGGFGGFRGVTEQERLDGSSRLLRGLAFLRPWLRLRGAGRRRQISPILAGSLAPFHWNSSMA